jgi:CubicO group peptidase (beta-lactamase class C family)
MLLSDGQYHGKRVLSAASTKAMTAPRTVPGGDGDRLRTYGWDMNTGYSKNRGDLFPVGKSFGHTGFTGTSLWIDPTTQTAVIFLSNRVHPNGKGNVTRVRGQVATLVGSALPKTSAPTQPERGTWCGVDVLAKENFARLRDHFRERRRPYLLYE